MAPSGALVGDHVADILAQDVPALDVQVGGRRREDLRVAGPAEALIAVADSRSGRRRNCCAATRGVFDEAVDELVARGERRRLLGGRSDRHHLDCGEPSLAGDGDPRNGKPKLKVGR